MTDRVCDRCTFENPAGFNFCGRCGSRLESGKPAPPDPIDAPHPPRAERRQLTVVFCDLIGSTELSQTLDPEDLRRVIRAYQSACEPLITRHGGFVSRFLGDGILAIFGYPQAREDDAEQAVRAALGMIEAVGSIDWTSAGGVRVHPAVRVGIATGIVVAGDLIGKGAAEEEAVVGETPNLAARLQSLAEPNSVLIGSRTRRLVGQHFELTPLGKRVLKGFREAVEVWRVEAPIDVSTRFEAMRAAGITTLVDRHAELAFLIERWKRCGNSAAQTVVVSGEAGIGKSRLAQALREHIGDEPHIYLRFQCSPYHVNTALYPVIAHFERAAGISRTDGPAEKLAKLRGILPPSLGDGLQTLSAVAMLMSIESATNEGFERLSAEGRKRAIIDALSRQCVELSEARPVLVVVEDIHWIDPTSLELLEQVSRDTRDARILCLLTRRPGGTALPDSLADADHAQLTRLEPWHSTDLVEKVALGARLSPRIVARIVSKADGIPLFVEELTKTWLNEHHGTSDEERDAAALDSEIPDTLHDSLMARLDHTGPGKRVAQIAATIGRQFPYELLESVAEMGRSELRRGLDHLLESGLVFVEGHVPRASFTFKHALVRDTAYNSLLRAERRDCHLRIAETLERSIASTAPELLAWHFTEAGLHPRAIDYWLRAGQAASQRSAHREAVGQFQSGLKLLRVQPPGEQRDRRLLEYLVNLGPNLIATRGSGSAETEAVYQEAISLSESLPESENHFIAHWGWWRISGDFRTYAERAARLQRLAERLDDDGLKLQAHHCQWATRFHLGDHAACQRHARAGIELYADRDYRSHAARFGGHDARVCALGETAQSLWLTGHPDQAVASMRRARQWAEKLKQSGSLVHVIDMNLLLLRYRREPELAARQAKELIAFATESHFPEYAAKAAVFRGWSLAMRGEPARGIAMMRDGIASHDGIGTNEDPPVWLEMLADGCLGSGEYRAGIEAIDEAFRHAAASGLQFWQAELHRCRGELLQRLGEEFLLEACDEFERAIGVAEAQGALSLELRATVSLVRNAERRGVEGGEQQRLARVMSRFEEGFGTSDYLEALALRAAVADP